MKSSEVKYLRIALIVMGFLIVVLMLRSCDDRKNYGRLQSQLSEYQLKEKQYEVKRLSDSSTIATQSQTILTQKEAIEMGILELQKQMKEVQAQVKQKSEVVIKDKPIPFIPSGYADTTGWVRDASGNVIRKDSIAVPQRFSLKEKWFNIDGYVKKTGLNIDSLSIPNKTTVTIGKQKSGFLGLGRDPVVTVKNDNPYVNVTGLDNVVIKKKKPFWKSPFFTLLVGTGIGVYLKK